MVGIALSAVLVTVGAAVVPAQAADGQLTVTGHGYGHGRGMGQYGAYGYAVDHGWNHGQILAHYYGGTSLATDAGNPTIGVELTRFTNADTIVTGTSLALDGAAAGQPAMMLRKTAAGTVQVFRGPGCAGPWTSWKTVSSGATVASTGSQASLGNLVRMCEAGTAKGYRGVISVAVVGGTQYTLNRLTVDEYLRGVVPRESPASWGDAAGGRGLQALKAQSVAARSYALSSGARASGALTCDTTTCQVYGGALSWSGSTITGLEDARTDRAVSETSGQVMRAGNRAIARTEFSSSTGGWTAGGVFPAVQDLGDATASNPNRTWTVTKSYSQVATALGTGAIRSVAVTGRNGLGADGGRVTQVTVTTTTGATKQVTGSAFRSALGLKSDWFSVSGVSAQEAEAVVRALYQDILGREPDAEGLATWTTMVARDGDARQVARGIVGSTERLHTFIRAEYRAALKRAPEAAGLTHWTGYMQGGTNVPELQVFIYGSDEALLNLGGGDVGRWVDGVYSGILGRPASAAERSYWADVAARSDRPTVVRSVAMSDEAGLRRLDGYYATMLQRSPDHSGISTYLPLMRGNGDFLLPIEIGGSPEYWMRAQVR
jgi:SpoIID/LytB domain protein